MNLRLGGSEVRVRLERADAEVLARGEPCAHTMRVPGGSLRWRIDPGAAVPDVAWVAGELVIGAPAEKIAALLAGGASHDARLHARIPIEEGEVVLAVEIDLFDGEKRR